MLEMVRRSFCRHIAVLPEAAGIVFGGGFPRRPEAPWLTAAQRAIYHVQDELQRAIIDASEVAVALCDRGTLDGLAYWPLAPELYFDAVYSSRARELRRYAAVIHLRTPPESGGYDHANPLRIEGAAEAGQIDARVADAWSGHPRRVFVDSERDFLDKVAAALDLIRAEVPACCRDHALPELARRPVMREITP